MLADTAVPLDTRTCDQEPIHIPRSIQPHGVLLAVRAGDWQIAVASANLSELTGRPLEECLNRPLASVLGGACAALVQQATEAGMLSHHVCALGNFDFDSATGPQRLSLLAHRMNNLVVLEMEPALGEASFATLHMLVQGVVVELGRSESVEQLAQIAASELRRLTQFDRVLIYRFDEQWNGLVVAEDRNDELPSYLDLRFPASDIPRQARELYRLNRLRLIADANYQPVPLVPPQLPENNQPLDLSHATLRSVSPIHLQYMRNMETMCSMSISILRDDQLWGLISCHNRQPRHVSFQVRTACDYLGQVLSLQLASREHAAEFRQRIELKSLQSELLQHMAADDDFVTALSSQSKNLLRYVRATGAAILFENRCVLMGRTPTEAQVRGLAQWLSETHSDDLFQTDCLSQAYAPAAEYVSIASGLIAMSISKRHANYVLWFRPEVVQTVKWGGDPRKPVETDGRQLNPRRSFETWKEAVRTHSLPFDSVEVEAAVELRNAIVGIVLHKAEELGELMDELQRSNKELEAFSYSVSHDLRAPFRHIVGYAQLLREQAESRLGSEERRFLDMITESAQFAGALVDDLLAYSRVGRLTYQMQGVDQGQLLQDVLRESVVVEDPGRVRWSIAPLPCTTCDPIMLRLVWENLISNALKYSRSRAVAEIEVGVVDESDQFVFHVRDNGVGFDMAYAGKLFGVFQRLHRMEDFEGTGIGLANVRRIIARHGGRTWAEGQPEVGATFYFTLPKEA
jgi:light-regulated signal transduction histidine kinase (bacteriophytochrome)